MRARNHELIGDLFDNAIDVNDTIWYTQFETLYDAIIRTIDEIEESEGLR